MSAEPIAFLIGFVLGIAVCLFWFELLRAHDKSTYR